MSGKGNRVEGTQMEYKLEKYYTLFWGSDWNHVNSCFAQL